MKGVADGGHNMKRAILYVIGAIGLLLFFTACNNSSSPAPTTTMATCSPGMGYSAGYGCIQACPNNPSLGSTNGGYCNVPLSNTSAIGPCAANMVSTQIGCLQQCPGNPGYGIYNGQCMVPASSGANTYGSPYNGYNYTGSPYSTSYF